MTCGNNTPTMWNEFVQVCGCLIALGLYNGFCKGSLIFFLWGWRGRAFQIMSLLNLKVQKDCSWWNMKYLGLSNCFGAWGRGGCSWGIPHVIPILKLWVSWVVVVTWMTVSNWKLFSPSPSKEALKDVFLKFICFLNFQDQKEWVEEKNWLKFMSF